MNPAAWRWGLLGAAIAFVIHPVTIALTYLGEPDPTGNMDLRPLGYVAFAFGIATPVSIIVGAALAWRPRPRYRPLGLGLIAGTGIGALIGTLWLLALA